MSQQISSLSTMQEDAVFKKKIRQEYVFDDQGKNLRGKEINLTLVWDVIPRVGAHMLPLPQITLDFKQHHLRVIINSLHWWDCDKKPIILDMSRG